MVSHSRNWLCHESGISLCLYLRHNDNLAILSLYLDDILLAGNCPNMIIRTKTLLASRFEMKDMGPAIYVCEFEVLEREIKNYYTSIERSIWRRDSIWNLL